MTENAVEVDVFSRKQYQMRLRAATKTVAQLCGRVGRIACWAS